MSLLYANGDVEFDKNGTAYLWLMQVEDTLAELIKKRKEAHSSFPNTVYIVDCSRTKHLLNSSGMTRGKRTMCLIVEKLGAYYDIQQREV